MQAAVCEDIQFDNYRRMAYHPDFHPNHGRPYSESDKEYLCKYWDHDHRRSMSFALGRPEGSLATQVDKLKKMGMFDYYKHLNKHW